MEPGLDPFEPPRDKTNKMACAPSEDWSESLLSPWRKLGSLATQWVHSENPDQPGHLPFCWFCHEVAHLWLRCVDNKWHKSYRFHIIFKGMYEVHSWNFQFFSSLRINFDLTSCLWIINIGQNYHKNRKFLDRQAWASSVDVDRAAPRGESDQYLHCLPFHLHFSDSLLCGRDTLFKF